MTVDQDRAHMHELSGGSAFPAENASAGRTPGLSRRQRSAWVALVLLAIAGAAVMAYFTRRGIGLWEDSFDYITAARTLVESGRLGRIDGFGNFRPMTHFPPAYPWALALFDSAGLDIYSAARWLNVGLFGLTILLTGTCLRKATGSTRWGIVGAALVLSSEVLIGVHLWALTEPMYLTLALSSILLEALSIPDTGDRGRDPPAKTGEGG